MSVENLNMSIENQRLTQEERDDFIEVIRDLLDRIWPSATLSANRSSSDAIDALAEIGVFDLAEAEALELLIDLTQELGTRALPAPVADAFVAATLSADLSSRIRSGEARVVVHIGAAEDSVIAFGATDATNILFLDPSKLIASVATVTKVSRQSELSFQSAARVSFHDDMALDASPKLVERSIAIMLLAQGARIIGAVRRGHELAVEHAKTRQQFGRLIGSFGAVQQRIASCQINVSANNALLEEAVSSLALEAPESLLAVNLAIQHIMDTAVEILSGSQHTLGAIGYFDEHDMSWLFRSVHSDLTLLQTRMACLPAAARLDSQLLDENGKLPGFKLGDEAEELRTQVRSLLSKHKVSDGFDVENLRSEASDLGFFSLSWPKEEGGAAASFEEQVVLNEEMKYAGGPVDRAMSATMLIGHALLRHGTPSQKAEFLPLLRSGTMDFCLGYSEPEAGSDLASLRTRAVRSGEDEWTIDGQKLWTTRAQNASHVWLAVRTDPDARPRHAGITIFLVPMDTPGITIQEHKALSGEISCTVFYDQVKVPDSARVGEVNEGWKVITDALAAERVVMGGIAATILGHFDSLLDWCRRNLSSVTTRQRNELMSIAAQLQAARALVLAATRAMSGNEARFIGPVAAVLSGTLAERFARTAVDVVGMESFVGESDVRQFEAFLRLAPMYVIGGGTNDIQRGIIARSLGLPRE